MPNDAASTSGAGNLTSHSWRESASTPGASGGRGRTFSNLNPNASKSNLAASQSGTDSDDALSLSIQVIIALRAFLDSIEHYCPLL